MRGGARLGERRLDRGGLTHDNGDDGGAVGGAVARLDRRRRRRGARRCMHAAGSARGMQRIARAVAVCARELRGGPERMTAYVHMHACMYVYMIVSLWCEPWVERTTRNAAGVGDTTH